MDSFYKSNKDYQRVATQIELSGLRIDKPSRGSSPKIREHGMPS